MCLVQKLRALVNERLTAAAEEIFELFERTIAEYEQEVLRLKQRNHKQLQQLDAAGIQIVARSRNEVGPGLEPPHIKEEPELCIKQEPEEFPFHMVSVKTEDDEDKSSVLHQRPTEENREETNGEDCGAEAGCSSDPLTQLHSDSEEHTDSSSDTDHSEDYSQEQAPAKRSYAMISPDSSVTDVGGTHRPYSCSDCGKTFMRKSHLRMHMSVHTGERPHKCSDCERSFRLKSNLKKHQRVQHHICPVCKKGFTRSFNLRAHMRSHSEDDYSVTDVGGTHRPYSCSECGIGFKWKSHLRMHMSVHTEERPFKCLVCERSFKKKSDLIRHLERVHRMCPVCKKHFNDKIELMKHMKTHVKDDSSVTDVRAPVKPYRCSECSKIFTVNSSLQRHRSVHTGERPHKCLVCGKGFRQKYDLVKHQIIHTGEKPFKCSVCEKAFTEKATLKAHMKIHTEKRPCVYSVHEKSFTEEVS